jgi:hypothetical protein
MMAQQSVPRLPVGQELETLTSTLAQHLSRTVVFLLTETGYGQTLERLAYPQR